MLISGFVLVMLIFYFFVVGSILFLESESALYGRIFSLELLAVATGISDKVYFWILETDT